MRVVSIQVCLLRVLEPHCHSPPDYLLRSKTTAPAAGTMSDPHANVPSSGDASSSSCSSDADADTDAGVDPEAAGETEAARSGAATDPKRRAAGWASAAGVPSPEQLESQARVHMDEIFAELQSAHLAVKELLKICTIKERDKLVDEVLELQDQLSSLVDELRHNLELAVRLGAAWTVAAERLADGSEGVVESFKGIDVVLKATAKHLYYSGDDVGLLVDGGHFVGGVDVQAQKDLFAVTDSLQDPERVYQLRLRIQTVLDAMTEDECWTVSAELASAALLTEYDLLRSSHSLYGGTAYESKVQHTHHATLKTCTALAVAILHKALPFYERLLVEDDSDADQAERLIRDAKRAERLGIRWLRGSQLITKSSNVDNSEAWDDCGQRGVEWAARTVQFWPSPKSSDFQVSVVVQARQSGGSGVLTFRTSLASDAPLHSLFEFLMVRFECCFCFLENYFGAQVYYSDQDGRWLCWDQANPTANITLSQLCSDVEELPVLHVVVPRMPPLRPCVKVRVAISELTQRHIVGDLEVAVPRGVTLYHFRQLLFDAANEIVGAASTAQGERWDRRKRSSFVPEDVAVLFGHGASGYKFVHDGQYLTPNEESRVAAIASAVLTGGSYTSGRHKQASDLLVLIEPTDMSNFEGRVEGT